MSEYVMVPREPTEAMLKAMRDAFFERTSMGALHAYRALAALSAPAPSQGAGIGREEVARAHWESERETLRLRSHGFDAGDWDDADPDTREMRLSAADAVLALLEPSP